MKRFLIFIAVLAIALGGLYIWWQMNATRLIDAQVKTLARNFFLNPENLTVDSKPVKMIGLLQARVPRVVIAGKNLQLRSGGRLASVKLVLTDIDVAGPPFHFSGVGGGAYTVSATDKDITAYLRKRGINISGIATIPLDTLNITFAKKTGTTLTGSAAVNLPFLHHKVPLLADGDLVPSSKNGQLDFRVKHVKLEGLSIGIKQVTDALAVVNPIVDVSDWPLSSDIKSVKTGDGIIVLHGQVTGIRPSFFP